MKRFRWAREMERKILKCNFVNLLIIRKYKSTNNKENVIHVNNLHLYMKTIKTMRATYNYRVRPWAWNSAHWCLSQVNWMLLFYTDELIFLNATVVAFSISFLLGLDLKCEKKSIYYKLYGNRHQHLSVFNNSLIWRRWIVVEVKKNFLFIFVSKLTSKKHSSSATSFVGIYAVPFLLNVRMRLCKIFIFALLF